MNWLQCRRQRRAEADYRRGWDYAAGELLRGREIEDIEAQIIGDDAFDKGANAACSAWERLTKN